MGCTRLLPGLEGLSTPRKIAIAGLVALGVLLAAALFLVYFGENEPEAIELTAAAAGAAERPNAGNPTAPADGTASPELAPRTETRELRLYMAGAVKNPGVYPLVEGDRLVDGVEAAGGATGDANLEAVNLAMRVEDEGYYYIPARAPRAAADIVADIVTETTEDVSPTPQFPQAATNRPTTESPAETDESTIAADEPGGPVNLNTATQAQLETLPSIGPARARAIIAFREENGHFEAVDEITAVSGIGQGILDNLQGLITVEASP